LYNNNIVLGNYKIKIDTIIEYLKISNKLLLLLNENAWDCDAIAKLKKVNNYFNELNRKYHYPKNWNYKDAIDSIKSINVAPLQAPKDLEKETPATN
jgi:hypothetical protein